MSSHKYTGVEPHRDGSEFHFEDKMHPGDDIVMLVDSRTARELAFDGADAYQLSRGRDRQKIFVDDTEERDWLQISEKWYMIASVLTERNHVVLQGRDDEFEVRIPSGEVITVYREIE